MSIVERIVFELGPWSWWILGLILLALEVLAPGTFFLWFGLAALIVGTLALFIDMAWQVSLVLFVAVSLICLFAGRALMRRSEDDTDEPHLNRRGDRLVGREFVLREPIVDGNGRIQVDDGFWRVAGPDCPEGTRVHVVRVEGAQVIVRPVDGR